MSPDALSDRNAFEASEPASAEFESFLSEVFGHSERAGAIVAVAKVDDTLSTAIQSRMVDLDSAEGKLLFSGQGPLSTLHAKIHIGFALALYKKAARDDMLTLKDIRNRFAHHIPASSFADPEVTRLCSRLHYPPYKAGIEGTPEKTSAEARFHETVGAIFLGLGMVSARPSRPAIESRWGILNYDPQPKPPRVSTKKRPTRPTAKPARE